MTAPDASLQSGKGHIAIMVRKARTTDEVMPPIVRRFVSLAEAATYTGFAERTLRRWVSEGKIRAHRATDNGDLRFTITDLDALLGA